MTIELRVRSALLFAALLPAVVSVFPGTADAQPAPPPEAPAPKDPPKAPAPPAKPGEGGPGEGKPGDGKPGEGKPGEGEGAAGEGEEKPPVGGEPLIPAPPPGPPAPAPAPPAPAPAKPPPAAPPTGQVAGEGSATVDPKADKQELLEQGERRPRPGAEVGAKPSDVFAEEWWSSARPAFEVHGYYRLRSELFHHFALGRRDELQSVIWPQPPDNDTTDIDSNRNQVPHCGDDPRSTEPCENNTQAGANMRFRISPELHISDNLRVMSQIDMLDNLVLGSTPEGYANQPGDPGGYQVVARGGYAPTGAFAATQWSPSSGQNSFKDSIQVKRAWGEYMTPFGLLRFGRQPSHWGLGMFVNSGDGYDSDYGSTADRIMFVTGIKQFDLYFAGAWDFANEGATSAQPYEQNGQPYDVSQLDDVSQWVLVVARRRNPDLQKLELARGDVVLNGGTYVVYRNQFLANDASPAGASLGADRAGVSSGYVRRGAEVVIPDLWFQFLYKKFRFEAEGTLIWGSLENTNRTAGSGTDYVNPADAEDNGWNIRQFGLATETEFRAVEDKLRVMFKFGYATGDQDIASLSPPAQGFQPQLTADRTFSQFRFHPDYRVDLILWRHILNRIQGGYYFRPSVEYDFNRDKNGQRLGGGAAIIWSRAAEFIQTAGNERDLGIELNFKLYYQAKDGTLNDDPDKMGGFYTSLEYGVLFPLGAFDYLIEEEQEFEQQGVPFESETAQTLRWYLGILF